MTVGESLKTIWSDHFSRGFLSSYDNELRPSEKMTIREHGLPLEIIQGDKTLRKNISYFCRRSITGHATLMVYRLANYVDAA